MTQNHWKVLAILGGAALGFFATSYMTGNTWPRTWGLSIYNQGVTSGGNYNV